MKSLICFLICCIYYPCFSQEIIEVGDTNVSLLIFDSPIESEYFSSDEFGRAKTTGIKNELILPLKYLKLYEVEKNASLLVVTADGQMHEFGLHYNKSPKKFMYKIASKNQKGTLTAPDKIKDVIPLVSDFSEGVKTVEHNSETPTAYTEDKSKRIKAYCRRTLLTNKKVFQRFDKESNVNLTLKQVSFDEEEIFFHFSFKNKGGQAYDIEDMFFETNPHANNSTKSNIEILPLMIFEKPEKIQGKTTVHFTVVFEKFSIDKHKNLEFNITEKEGDRDLLLYIDDYLISNPVKLNK